MLIPSAYDLAAANQAKKMLGSFKKLFTCLNVKLMAVPYINIWFACGSSEGWLVLSGLLEYGFLQLCWLDFSVNR